MRTDQCGRCLRYRGDLACDSFPRGIPEKILTGEFDHTKSYLGKEPLFNPLPDAAPQQSLTKSMVDEVNDMVDRESKGFTRIKSVLLRKGYVEEDFDPNGPLGSYTASQLLDLLGK